MNKILLFLRICGTQREDNESLMEAWARALGITCHQLRELLAKRIDPIQQYLNDRGIYHALKDALKTRKAAGTTPGGQ